MNALEELVARLSAGAGMDFSVFENVGKGPKRSKPTKLVTAVKALSKDLQRQLAGIITGDYAQVLILGRVYTVHKRDEYYAVQAFADGAEERVVDVKVSKCSCPDFKFREHKCKHIVALEKFACDQ